MDPTLQDQYEREARRFMEAVYCIPAHHVTQALNTLTPGVDWRGMQKGKIAEEYARSVVEPRRAITPRLGRINLRVLTARAAARNRGTFNWQEAQP